ncbi:unnamed protein product [Phytophthora lilii]|uniref:Unnamed protein product n=1 Tax=Phytophthora lilii TaxID=2077276 RepID=A0A9W6U5G8_9STRA|nr:unnamed protein product [Phytophthora lilii]
MQLSDWEQRPLLATQLRYAGLDALCLIQVIDKLQQQDGSGNSLPGWAEVCQHISNLKHTSSLSKTDTVDLISLRVKYQKAWALQTYSKSESNVAGGLVSPLDVAQVWKERRAVCAQELSELSVSFDASLKLLPMDQITALLEDASDNGDTRNFIAVNSIYTPCVVCIDASYKLDMAQFARFCGVGRRRVRLATASECREVFGFTPGTVAPFGHKMWSPVADKTPAQPQQIEVYVDASLQHVHYLAAGSGSEDEVIWVESKAFFALININLVDDVSVPRDSSRPLSPNSIAARVETSNAESDDIIEKEPKLLEYKFLTDSMVTQVGRWLRTIGVDVVTWDPDNAMRSNDPKSTMLAYAAEEDRIVLTRDTSLPIRRDAGACFVLSDDECYKQFREVKLQFGLLDQIGTRSSRCARCNSDTFSPIAATSARKKLSERLRKKVPISVTKFWICGGCSRIYWEGPKPRPGLNMTMRPAAQVSVALRVTHGLVRWSPCGRYIAAASGNRLVIRDAQSLQTVQRYSTVDVVQAVAWSEDSQLVLTAMHKRAVVQVWSVQDASWSCKIAEGVAGLVFARWTPDARHVVTVSDFQLHATVWSLEDPTARCSIRSPKLAGDGLSFSANGEFLAVAERHDCKVQDS